MCECNKCAPPHCRVRARVFFTRERERKREIGLATFYFNNLLCVRICPTLHVQEFPLVSKDTPCLRRAKGGFHHCMPFVVHLRAGVQAAPANPRPPRQHLITPPKMFPHTQNPAFDWTRNKIGELTCVLMWCDKMPLCDITCFLPLL